MGMFGNISSYNPTIADRLSWGAQNALERFGVNRRTANSYGQKVRGAVDWLPYIGDAAAAEQGLRMARQGAEQGSMTKRLAGSTMFGLAALPLPAAADKVLGRGLRRLSAVDDYSKFIGHIKKSGLQFDTNASSLSKSKYVNVSIPTGKVDGSDPVYDILKVRISDHQLPPTEGARNGYADYEVGNYSPETSHYLDVISDIYKRAGIEPKGPTRAALTKLSAKRTLAKQKADSLAAEYAARRDSAANKAAEIWPGIKESLGLPADLPIDPSFTNPETMRKRAIKWMNGDIYALGFPAVDYAKEGVK